MLFPDHLPDLHTPTKESYNEAIKLIELQPVSRLYAKIPVQDFNKRIIRYLALAVCVLIILNILWWRISDNVPEELQRVSPFFSLIASVALVQRVWGGWTQYEEGYNKWCVGTEPTWKSLNKKRIIDWYQKHIKFLEARGVERQIIDGQLHIIREYCRELKALPWKVGESDTFTTTVNRFDFGSKSTLQDVETTDTDEYLQYMDKFLRDEVLKLSSVEKEAYFRFSGLAAEE